MAKEPPAVLFRFRSCRYSGLHEDDDDDDDADDDYSRETNACDLTSQSSGECCAK